MTTDNPQIPGIELIPNIQSKIDAMIDKYRAETIDIEDVKFEGVDLELDKLFQESNNNEGKSPLP